MLSIKHLCKNYINQDKSFPALKDISIDFPDVQFVAILGPSGCGKTTLLNLIGGLDDITSGDIFLNDVSLKKRTARELNSYRNNEIGFIFQDYYLIPNFTALDNVKIGLAVRNYKSKEVENKSLFALEKIGILDLKDKKPSQLSGGQQQRVAIARALATDPKIILADEPTGALDSKSSSMVMDILKDISKTRLVIMVTHNEELANAYADRIIRLQDGQVIYDSAPFVPDAQNELPISKKERKSRLPLLMTLKFAFQNLFTKKMKTALTCITSSLGMLGISFFLSLNNGFNHYSSRLSEVTASSLPVILNSYTYKTDTESETFGQVNFTEDYPDTDEIYPIVSTDSITDYSFTFNNFTPKFMSFLDGLIDKGLASEYVINYGNSYSFNLVTKFPDAISSEKEGGYEIVNTSLVSQNSISSRVGLPTNIFHVLYGDLNDYDVLEGHLPTNKNELVLVVNENNAIDFSTLQELGFYNQDDVEDDVKDQSLSTKVKPISFKDVIGKEYKVFDNDEFFTVSNTIMKKDSLDNERTLTTYQSPADLETFYNTHGEKLTITAIIRPKRGSDYNLLSPSLCFLPELQEELVEKNLSSSFATDMKNNAYINFPSDTVSSNFIDEIKTIFKEYLSSKDSFLPSSKLNDFFDKYLVYQSILSETRYVGLNALYNEATEYGADLIPESFKGLDLSDKKNLNVILTEFETAWNDKDIKDIDKIYELLEGIHAYINGFTNIRAIVIIPQDLNKRQKILDAITEFNKIDESSSDHASSIREQVFYSTANESWMVSSVGEVIDMTSTILLIFAAVSLTVSVSMIALITSKNVLEREKEIGLLRALGSRKFDIARLFETEALIIGLFTGFLGALLGYALSFPINNLINSYYPTFEVGMICDFTFVHALIVISISLIISFLAALIPSYHASKKDPAKCLKSE